MNIKNILFVIFTLSLFYVGSVFSEELAQNDYVFSKVVIKGNQRVDTAAIRTLLSKEMGAISPEEISEDIKTFYRTGFFDQVIAEVIEDLKGRVLQYKFVEKPIVRKVFIQGNDAIDEDDLKEVFQFGAKRFLDKKKIKSLIDKATSKYQEDGYYDVAFTYSVLPLGNNQVDLTFEVDEGDRYIISRINLLGLKEVDEDEALDAIQTKRYKWYSSWLFGTGRLNLEILENDRLLLKQYFMDLGYIDVGISEPAIEKGDKELIISFQIKEGTRYMIGDITAVGDLINDSEEKTIDGIALEEGDYFNGSLLRKDSFVISDKFGDIGYAFANVTPGTQVNRDLSEININYNIDKGKLVKVNRIKIKGNDKTYDNVIRRELKIDEQDIYSGKKLKRSEALLKRRGYFDEVGISTETTDRDDQIDLLVNVREGSTGSFSAGAGYSSTDGAIVNTRYSENNMMGTGRNVNVNFDIGTERESLILSLNDNRFNDTYLSLGGNLMKAEREYSDFNRVLTGGSLVVGYPLEEFFGEWAEDIHASLKYEYLSIDIDNVDLNDAAQLVIDQQGNSTASGFTPRLIRNTIDNPINPTKGSQQILSFEITGFGGNQEYYLFEANQQIYRPLFEFNKGKMVFSWRTKLGYGDTLDDKDFPLFRRYFPGGINTVRGFKNRTLGPKDADRNEYGGSKQFVNNLELIFPIVQSAGLKGVVFFDVGEAFDDDENISFADLRQAWGYGIRWMSPLGPIRIEFGYPLDAETGENSMVTLFSFGAPL